MGHAVLHYDTAVLCRPEIINHIHLHASREKKDIIGPYVSRLQPIPQSMKKAESSRKDV